jgi:hypothetical protein
MARLPTAVRLCSRGRLPTPRRGPAHSPIALPRSAKRSSPSFRTQTSVMKPTPHARSLAQALAGQHTGRGYANLRRRGVHHADDEFLISAVSDLVRAVINAWLCTSAGWGSGVARPACLSGACLPDRGTGQQRSAGVRKRSANGIQQKPLNHVAVAHPGRSGGPRLATVAPGRDRMPPSRSPSTEITDGSPLRQVRPNHSRSDHWSAGGVGHVIVQGFRSTLRFCASLGNLRSLSSVVGCAESRRGK